MKKLSIALALAITLLAVNAHALTFKFRPGGNLSVGFLPVEPAPVPDLTAYLPVEPVVVAAPVVVPDIVLPSIVVASIVPQAATPAAHSVPEPAPWILLATGLVGLVLTVPTRR